MLTNIKVLRTKETEFVINVKLQWHRVAFSFEFQWGHIHSLYPAQTESD